MVAELVVVQAAATDDVLDAVTDEVIRAGEDRDFVWFEATRELLAKPLFYGCKFILDAAFEGELWCRAG